MNDQFLPEAGEEFREAARYYESEAPGVGLAFIAEVHRAVQVIVLILNLPKSFVTASAKKYYPISHIACFIPTKPTWYL